MRGTVMPASRLKYSGGGMRLYGLRRVVERERLGLRAPVLGAGERVHQHGGRAGDVDDAPAVLDGALDGDEVLVAGARAR